MRLADMHIHTTFSPDGKLCSEFSVNARFHVKTVHILISSEQKA